MNLDGSASEIAYRQEQLQRIGIRRPATSRKRRQRRSWFARLRTTSSEASAPPAVSTLTVPVVAPAAVHD
jgi:hypothetical protein